MVCMVLAIQVLAAASKALVKTIFSIGPLLSLVIVMNPVTTSSSSPPPVRWNFYSSFTTSSTWSETPRTAWIQTTPKLGNQYEMTDVGSAVFVNHWELWTPSWLSSSAIKSKLMLKEKESTCVKRSSLIVWADLSSPTNFFHCGRDSYFFFCSTWVLLLRGTKLVQLWPGTALPLLCALHQCFSFLSWEVSSLWQNWARSHI